MTLQEAMDRGDRWRRHAEKAISICDRYQAHACRSRWVALAGWAIAGCLLIALAAKW